MKLTIKKRRLNEVTDGTPNRKHKLDDSSLDDIDPTFESTPKKPKLITTKKRKLKF